MSHIYLNTQNISIAKHQWMHVTCWGYIRVGANQSWDSAVLRKVNQFWQGPSGRVNPMKNSSTKFEINLISGLSANMWKLFNQSEAMKGQGDSMEHDQKLNPDITHWGQDKMAAIFETTFSNAVSWMKIHVYKFQLRFRWSLFLRSVRMKIFQHWFR